MNRRTVVIVLAAVVLVAAAVGVVMVVQLGKAKPECSIPAASGATEVQLDAVQLQNASTINAVGIERGLPERARIIAIATAFQESSLRNVDSGDRDSVGLFQQRPSQGWGTAAQVIDPVYAAGKFYEALLEVDDWQKLPLTQAAQAVQRSAYPDAYAQWEDEAATLSRTLGGSVDPALVCRAGAQSPTAPAPTRKALPGSDSANPSLSTALAAAGAELGALSVVSAQGGTATVTLADNGLKPGDAARATASWFVAHQAGFGVADVRVGALRYTDNAWTTGGLLPAGHVAVTVG